MSAEAGQRTGIVSTGSGWPKTKGGRTGNSLTKHRRQRKTPDKGEGQEKGKGKEKNQDCSWPAEPEFFSHKTIVPMGSGIESRGGKVSSGKGRKIQKSKAVDNTHN